MTKTTTSVKYLVLCFILLITVNVSAQELLDIGETSAKDSLLTTSLRSKTAFSIGAGSTLINGDFSNPDYENFLNIALTQFFTPSIAINGDLKKFDIKNYDFDDNGFLSGDVNVQWYLFPQNKLTPIIYAGPGVVISNDFDDKNYKVQGGIGLDYLVLDCLSIVGSLEANYIYDEQVGSQLLQEADALYYNAKIGVQFYFGNSKTRTPKASKDKKVKTKKEQSSIIQSNWIGRTDID